MIDKKQVEKKLNDLYEYRFEQRMMEKQLENSIIALISPENLEKYNELQKKFAQDSKDMKKIIKDCEEEIVGMVKELKESVSTDNISATFVLGGEIWDSSALDELAQELPQLYNCRKEKADSVRFYEKKK